MATEGYHDIGALLRKNREDLRLSVEETSRMLHIRARYILALEEGRLDELPGLPYVRGYLQSYATFLQLDKDEILRQFEDIERELASRHLYFPQAISKEKRPTQPVIIIAIAVAAIAYVLWVIYLQPHKASISMVEPMKKQETPSVIVYLGNEACLQDQTEYYPPCTADITGAFSLLPLSHPMYSIMDLPLQSSLANPKPQVTADE